MTDIYIHGKLSDNFPHYLSMSLRKASDVMSAIDAACDGFRLACIKLSNSGIHYGIIVDHVDIRDLDEVQLQRQPERIDLVPMIVGSGPIAAATAVVVGAGGMIAGGMGATFWGLTASQIGMAGLMIAGMGLQMLLAPKPDIQRPESVVSGLQESSFLASSSANLMTQGSPLPIGYGRLRVGSSVINVTTKSFQVSKKQKTAMLSNTSGKISAETQISTKQGNKNR